MSDTGRYMITDKKTGRRFVVEPIHGKSERPQSWGDVDPATKKLTGQYGKKRIGSISEEESIITEENGFKNIVMLPPGTSPEGYIEELLKKDE